MAQRAQRRLAAIVAVDVAGYSRLIGADEEVTLAALRAHRRELIDPLIGEHGGRIANTAGDSLLLEFPSVVDAVRCSIAVQEGMRERNRSVDDDRRIRLRVGIHLGDVIAEGNDLLGDGVNVAARLEGLSPPGDVVLSDDAYRQIRDRLDYTWIDDGEHEVKNIARPIRVWRWAPEDMGAAVRTAAEPALALPDKPSIAVLPFNNLSGDPEQEFFADGVAEDITTGLSCIRSFFVIARNSSFVYRGRSVDVNEVARELGVRYVLEGSVRRAGQRIRVTAQLIDAPSRNHIWAQRFDRDLDDIFAVQDEITSAIVAAIGPEVDSAERERALRRPTDQLDAWSAYQRGLWHVYRYDGTESACAIALFEQALLLDPNLAAAHSGLSNAHYINAFLGFGGAREQEVEGAYRHARRAVVLDDKDATSHWSLGRAYRLMGELDPAISSFRTALALNPNSAPAHYGLGWALVLAGKTEEGALDLLDQALRLSPRDPQLFSFLIVKAMAHCILGNEGEALRNAELAAQQSNAHAHVVATYAAMLELAGKHEQAGKIATRLLRDRPDYRCSLFRAGMPFRRTEDIEPIIERMRKAGLPE